MSADRSRKELSVVLKGTSILIIYQGQAYGYMPFHLTFKDTHTTDFVNICPDSLVFYIVFTTKIPIFRFKI